MTHHSAALMLCCLAILPGASAATILNPSFEQPVTSSFTYNPLDPTLGWTFSGRTGVAINTFFTPPPPDGNQAAFIQQASDQPTSLSSITQSLAGVALTPSQLVFFLAQRPDHSVNPINVLYGSQNLGTFTPASTTFQQITINFTPLATSGVLTFQSAATTGGDLNSALDLVSFTQATSVPEPASAILILPSLAALVLFRRHRGKKFVDASANFS